MTKIHPLAGQKAPLASLTSIPELVSAYYKKEPNPQIAEQKIKFGTSGHRGSSLKCSFNEAHILCTTQAICDLRQSKQMTGPIFVGIDTHALSIPAYISALEVLVGNGCVVMLAENDEYTPTPVISHAILTYNKGRKEALADGIVITPSHNPPADGGFKYNPPNGGPADVTLTKWIEEKANGYMAQKLKGVKRIPYESALKSDCVHRHSFLESYVSDLINVIDMKVIKDSQIKMAVDPLGGAGVHYWRRIAEKWGLNLTVVSERVDPTFSFMTLDWDGKIRMDPSSPYAMQRLISQAKDTKVAFGCDTDHDRHGIVTASSGLLQPNHFLSASIDYLFSHRPLWSQKGGVGKTLVSSHMIDFVCAKYNRSVYEVPVGFKWFVDGLIDGSLLYVGEESAGSAFARLDGSVWTTDKDGITASLLAAEMTARTGKDPGEIYKSLTEQFGISYFERYESEADAKMREAISNLEPQQIHIDTLAGEKVEAIFNRAPGNHQLFGGIKVVTRTGWFAARPSGTEDITRIYVESFKSEKDKELIFHEAETLLKNFMG